MGFFPFFEPPSQISIIGSFICKLLSIAAVSVFAVLLTELDFLGLVWESSEAFCSTGSVSADFIAWEKHIPTETAESH